ncbi:hypothetical protein ACFO5T_12665 [Dokdonia genika]|uniref:Uncharacterized protein n=1 Tax=Dokdonia genika TaxID=308113 RepID=A0ABV9LAU4_9FLAO
MAKACFKSLFATAMIAIFSLHSYLVRFRESVLLTLKFETATHGAQL